LHLGESSFPVGKVEYLEMFPMSFLEFMEASGQNRYSGFLRDYTGTESIPALVHSHLWEQLKLYFVIGGLPEVVKTYADNKDDLFNSLLLVRQKHNDLIRDYLADIAKHSGKQNSMHIERIWKNVPSQLAREQDGSAPKFRFKGVVPGLKAYSRLAGGIDWLEASGLIIKAHIVNSGEIPFSAYTKDNYFKLFCFDVGLLGSISRLPPKAILDYDYGTYKGYFAENFVAQEFRCAGVDKIYSWRERTAEVEFLREVNGKVLPVEVKSGRNTQAKSLKVFAEKYNPKYRSIMSARSLNIDHENGIHHYPLYMAAHFPLFLHLF
jgi:predicted AAA+ superfamily ATPase